MSGIGRRTLLAAAGAGGGAGGEVRLAPTPPMGWNSFATVTAGHQALEQVAIMAARLHRRATTFTVDILRHEPEACSHN